MWNIAGYSVYLIMTILVIIFVGWKCHHAGRPFLLSVFEDDPIKANISNNLLLMGYYIVNIGYAAILIADWPTVASIQTLIGAVAGKTGTLLLILGILHYTNLALIGYLYKKRTNLSS